ncbi:unnamed protein product [Closterium sp. NIES-53]
MKRGSRNYLKRTTSSMKEIQNVQQQLMKNFKCKTLGEVKYYLGMHVERDLDHRWLTLHQEKFIKELGEKYGIENEHKVATPLPAEFKLVKAAEDEGVEAEEQQQFQSLVGSLLYAAVHTRPEISFSVGQLARVVQNPSEEQVDAAEHVVKYLNSHPSIGVQYSASAQVKQKGVEVLKEKGERLGEGKLFLTCFTDATWASEKDDSSSVGGFICVAGGGPVSWRSKKQTETALSSVESDTSGMGLVLVGWGPVVLTCHADASWVDDSATQRSSQGYTFSLGSGSVSWRSTRSSSVLSSSCEAEIYAGAMAAQELHWLTYLQSDLGEQPRSPPVLYVDNKAMISLCQEHRLEHRTKHIAVRYFLARELQQRGQLCLAYVASRTNTADIFTKALQPGDHQRFSTMLGLVPTLPHLLTA